MSEENGFKPNEQVDKSESTEDGPCGPTGVSLKAAWLVLQELQGRQGLPSIEELALILDRTLNYEWAIYG